MSYSVRLKRSAEKELQHLPQSIHDRIVRHLLELENKPRPSGVIKLTGQEAYRLRVGDYRIIYLINDPAQAIEIIAIRHRREAYR